jgi:protein involved in polysaccharide export with SLBB domain
VALLGLCLAPSLRAQEAAATPGVSASASVPALPAPAPSAPAAEDPAGYRVAVGDELNFRFFYMPSLNTVAVVRPDGKLALPLAGELQVDGLTMGELSALVEKLLAAQVRRPQVTINVQGVGARRVFVGGEVTRPGVQPFVGPLTVLQAVMVAEGLKDTAQPSKAIVMRRGPKGERLVVPVDLSAALAGAEGAQDLALQPYDVVVVPKSGVANLNVWVDQYIRRMLPFSLGFSYTINRNGAVQ